jgi:Zn finger protein HypA/HybF involved in hydrogenase expression
VKKEIFEEYVEMKCLDCDHEETADFDMLQETMEFDDSPYPSLYCPSCNEGTMVPKDIYSQLKKKK